MFVSRMYRLLNELVLGSFQQAQGQSPSYFGHYHGPMARPFEGRPMESHTIWLVQSGRGKSKSIPSE